MCIYGYSSQYAFIRKKWLPILQISLEPRELNGFAEEPSEEWEGLPVHALPKTSCSAKVSGECDIVICHCRGRARWFYFP